MTCHVSIGFVFHSPDFSVEAPGGWAVCRRCRGLVHLDRFTGESCSGVPAERPIPPDAIACVRCDAPILVDPMHRATVAFFGGTCDRCFDSSLTEAAHV